MVDEKYIALINQELDDANSPRETAILKDYLAANSEAQQLLDELAATANMLREVKAVEPPPDLKNGVLRAIQPQRRAARAKKPVMGGIKSLVEIFFGSPSYQLKYAYVFAIGLIAGLGIFALSSHTSQPTIDNSNLSGTLAWRETGGFETADSIAVDLEVGRATVWVKSSPQQVIAEVSLNTIREVKAQIEFEEKDLGLSSVSQLNGAAIHAMSGNERSLKLISEGENRYLIGFTGKMQVASPLRFKLFASEVLVYETTLATARPLR
jgi:hypothetical protein